MRYRDPVCGMEIRWEEAVDYEVIPPVVVYFCCAGCAARFREDPERHVDVRAWVAGEGDPADGTCGGEPLPLAPDEATARGSRTLATALRVGDLTLDELEALIVRHWDRLLGAEPDRLRTRTLERALLTYALAEDPDRRRDIDRLLAAEVARLRARTVDRDRIEEELALLPRAFAAVLLDVSVGPARTARLYEAVEAKLEKIRPWVFSYHGAGTTDPAGFARAS